MSEILSKNETILVREQRASWFDRNGHYGRNDPGIRSFYITLIMSDSNVIQIQNHEDCPKDGPHVKQIVLKLWLQKSILQYAFLRA